MKLQITLGIIYLIVYELNPACYLIIPSWILAEFLAKDYYLCKLWVQLFMSFMDE